MAEYATSIEIDAPPARVFDYLVTEAGLTAWMGQHATLAPEPGGEFAVDIAGHAIRGRYLRVERPHRVVVSWGVAASDDLPPGSSTVEFRLTPIANGTRVDLVHSGLPAPELRGHADGWAYFLPRLQTVATGGNAGPDDWRPINDPLPDPHHPPRSPTVTATSRTSSLETVLTYHRSWTGGDIDRAMDLVAEDIVCRAPGADLVGKDAYRAYLAGFAPSLTGLTDVASLADDNHVALFYYPHTATTSAAPAAEYFTVEDGAIVENLLVFDRLSFAPPGER